MNTNLSSQNAITCFNGSACLVFNPDQNQFWLSYSTKIMDATNNINISTISGKQNAFSATLIGVNMIVFSTSSGITIFIPPSFSIDIETDENNVKIPQFKSILPSPIDYMSFFGLSDNKLYQMSLDPEQFVLRMQLIQENVSHFSLNKTTIMIQIDQSVHFYNYDSLDFPVRTIDNPENSIYYIDDDNLYKIFDFNNDMMQVNIQKIDQIENSTITPINFQDVIKVFDSFEVVLLLKDNNFCYKGTKFNYKNVFTGNSNFSLFAGCSNELCFWESQDKPPKILKGNTSVSCPYNCWLNKTQPFIFFSSQNSQTFHYSNILKCKKNFFLLTRAIKVNNAVILIHNGTFSAYFDSASRITPNCQHLMASADFYRTDPQDIDCVFAHFRQSTEVYHVKFTASETNSEQLLVEFAPFLSNVIQFDVSRNYFAAILKDNNDSNAFIIKLMKRDIIPFTIFELKQPDHKFTSVFLDDMFVYLYDNKNSSLTPIRISDKMKFDPILNVKNVWSTDGIVIQLCNGDFIIGNQLICIRPNYSVVCAAVFNYTYLSLWDMETKSPHLYSLDLPNLPQFNQQDENLSKQIASLGKRVQLKLQTIRAKNNSLYSTSDIIDFINSGNIKKGFKLLLKCSDEDFNIVLGKTKSIFKSQTHFPPMIIISLLERYLTLINIDNPNENLDYSILTDLIVLIDIKKSSLIRETIHPIFNKLDHYVTKLHDRDPQKFHKLYMIVHGTFKMCFS